ncbi:MAG: nucleotidyl transferase AbiEii/AbiGii toxin family protein [Endomicrobiales bacterium]|jgi:hypothetical protein
MHALISRKYTKGRDFFDIGWYLSKWPGLSPNIPLLRNALKQTQWKGELPTELTWRSFLHEIVKSADWHAVVKDIDPFLENPSDVAIISKDNILALIDSDL